MHLSTLLTADLSIILWAIHPYPEDTRFPQEFAIEDSQPRICCYDWSLLSFSIRVVDKSIFLAPSINLINSSVFFPSLSNAASTDTFFPCWLLLWCLVAFVRCLWDLGSMRECWWYTMVINLESIIVILAVFCLFLSPLVVYLCPCRCSHEFTISCQCNCRRWASSRRP